MKKNKNYIICGIPPSNGGVGRTMKYLIKYNDDNFCIIYPKIFYPEGGLRILLRKKLYFQFFKQFIKSKYSKIINKIIFNVRIRLLKSKNIIFIHPQTIGFKNIFKVINDNNCFIYIMDCSFFCVKSYNHIEGTFNPCLLCLGGNYEFAKSNNCKPSPVKYKLNENIRYLRELSNISKKIKFIVQTSSHAKLIKKHFGNKIKVYKVELFADDFLKMTNKSANTIEENNRFDKIDFVYHGAAIEAKGLLYVIKIAMRLKQYTFLIPASFERCKKIISNKLEKKCVKNILFKDITWENGLKEYVINSKIILCPSLWSAPIEGTLIKSFIFNGVVALVPSKYSFVNDLPSSIYCKLDVDNSVKTVKVLTELICNNNLRANLKRESQKWVNVYLEKNKYLVKKLDYIVNNYADNQT